MRIELRVVSLLALVGACSEPQAIPNVPPDAAAVDTSIATDAAAVTACVHTGWTVEIIDDGTALVNVGMESSLVSTSDGTIHVVYTASDGHLRYARRASGATAWTIETLDFGGVNVRLANAADGTLHLGYTRDLRTVDHEEHVVGYATRPPAGSWTREERPTGTTRWATGLAMALDGQDVHLVYATYPEQHVTYAARTGGTWTVEPLQTGNAGDTNVAIVVDAARDVHVTYKDLDQGTLRYTRRSAGTWHTAMLDGVSGATSDLFADGSGALYAAYDTDWGPRFAVRPPASTWQPFERVSTTGYVYQGATTSSAGIDVVSVVGSHNLLFVTRRIGSQTWSTTAVNPDATPPARNPAIAIDPAGGRHVTFAHAYGGILYHAHDCP